MSCKMKEALPSKTYEDILSVSERNLPWEEMNGKTVLITGANGFICYYLVNALLIRNDLYQAGIKVIGLVRNEEKARKRFGEIFDRDDFQVYVQDVCDELQIEEKADYVIHAASQASAIQFKNDPVGTINANLAGTINILEYAKKYNSVVLFISSLKVYGAVHDGSRVLKEETVGYLDHTNYLNCYAMGKRVAETICASYAQQYGMQIKIVRPSYIYGAASLTDDRVWAQFMANVIRKENIVLKSNGAAYRSFCYVTDTAAAIFTVLLKGENVTAYNIAADNSNITIRNFARAAVEVFPERGLTLSFVNKEDEVEPEISYLSSTPEILDGSRLQALGWEAEVDIKEGIRRGVGILEEQLAL